MKLIIAANIKNNNRIYLLIFSECFAIVREPITDHSPPSAARVDKKKKHSGQTAMTADWPKRILVGYWFVSEITSQK